MFMCEFVCLYGKRLGTQDCFVLWEFKTSRKLRSYIFFAKNRQKIGWPSFDLKVFSSDYWKLFWRSLCCTWTCWIPCNFCLGQGLQFGYVRDSVFRLQSRFVFSCKGLAGSSRLWCLFSRTYDWKFSVKRAHPSTSNCVLQQDPSEYFTIRRCSLDSSPWVNSSI